MVKSGLDVRISVSQYRLAIHLGMAVLLLGAILWVALEYLRGTKTVKANAASGLAWAFVALVFVQMMLGALVAGLHAGLKFNTWPLMDGNLLPSTAFANGWLSVFENPGLAQFDHRMAAYAVVAFAWVLWSWLRTKNTAPLSLMAKRASTTVLAITALQIILGIETLLYQVPVTLAALHQVIAALLFSAAIWLAFELHQSDKA
jgi:cytochrome c oxidase assembly protein subunit 15